MIYIQLHWLDIHILLISDCFKKKHENYQFFRIPELTPIKKRDPNIQYFLYIVINSRDEYVTFDIANTTNDTNKGILIELLLFPQYPNIGLNINCPRGFAPTIKPINSLPAAGSN